MMYLISVMYLILQSDSDLLLQTFSNNNRASINAQMCISDAVHLYSQKKCTLDTHLHAH